MKLLGILALTILLNPSAIAVGQQSTDDDQVDADRIVASVQKICPISGNALGEHGDPIKVKIGEEELFVCCRACLEDNAQVDPDHWATIHDNFSKAQGICPVMEHDIPENAKWTIVSGRIFYVCCPPCTDKIEEEPEEFVQKLLALYQASIEREGQR